MGTYGELQGVQRILQQALKSSQRSTVDSNQLCHQDVDVILHPVNDSAESITEMFYEVAASEICCEKTSFPTDLAQEKIPV